MQRYRCLKQNRFLLNGYELMTIRKEDIFLIMDWRNAQISVLRQKEPLTRQKQQEYFDRVIWPSLNDEHPSQILFSFLKDNVFIGYGGIVHINWEDKRGEVSFLLNPERVADKDVYREDFLAYLHLLKEAAYDDLQFNRLTGETYDIRPFHVSIMEEAGFVLEGRMKRHVCLNGRYVDSLIHGHLREYDKLYRPSELAQATDVGRTAGAAPLIRSRDRIGVLVSSISRKVPMLHAVRAAATTISGVVCITGADADKACVGKHFTDNFWHMPQLSELTADTLQAYCQENGIRFIIPSRDGELLFFSSLKRRLAQEGISVMVSDEEPLQNCLDKLQFAERLASLGFPAIATAEAPNTIDAARFVVKERFGAGAKGVGLNLDREDAGALAAKLDTPIFQPFVPGSEYSVDVYIDCLGKCTGAIARRREIVVGGESQVTATVSHAKLEAMCAQIAESLGLYGHCVFQVIEDNKGNLHVVECNPRFGGASTLSVHAGLTSFLWFFCEGLGIEPGNYPFIRIQRELRQVRYPCDALFEVG